MAAGGGSGACLRERERERGSTDTAKAVPSAHLYRLNASAKDGNRRRRCERRRGSAPAVATVSASALAPAWALWAGAADDSTDIAAASAARHVRRREFVRWVSGGTTWFVAPPQSESNQAWDCCMARCHSQHLAARTRPPPPSTPSQWLPRRCAPCAPARWSPAAPVRGGGTAAAPAAQQLTPPLSSRREEGCRAGRPRAVRRCGQGGPAVGRAGAAALTGLSLRPRAPRPPVCSASLKQAAAGAAAVLTAFAASPAFALVRPPARAADSCPGLGASRPALVPSSSALPRPAPPPPPAPSPPPGPATRRPRRGGRAPAVPQRCCGPRPPPPSLAAPFRTPAKHRIALSHRLPPSRPARWMTG